MKEEDEADFTLKLKNNKWLKQGETFTAMLAQEGIIYDGIIGKGAYAIVISAYDEKLKRKVAVKVTDKRKAPKDYMETFLEREIKLICELDHPNIVSTLFLYELVLEPNNMKDTTTV